MSASIVELVISFGIRSAKPLHASAQVCAIGSKQEVIMVVHQNVGKKVYVKLLSHFSGSGQKKLAVIIIGNDILPFITTR